MGQQLLTPLSEGFLLGMGLIMGFGPQNSFILRQGVSREHVFTVALLASLVDLALIALGVGGVGRVVAQPTLSVLLSLAGACFLALYGWRSFAAALGPRVLEAASAGPRLERSVVVSSLLAISLLNPSTYLDTLLIIGGGAARYEAPLRSVFAFGATAASALWFFALAFGAARLGARLSRGGVGRLVDLLSGAVMWFVAGRLLWHLFPFA